MLPQSSFCDKKDFDKQDKEGNIARRIPSLFVNDRMVFFIFSLPKAPPASSPHTGKSPLYTHPLSISAPW